MGELVEFRKTVKAPASSRVEGHGQVMCLSGWKGAGKDTAADYLAWKHGYIKLSFAEALKDLVSQSYQIPRAWMDDRQLKEEPLLQYPVIPSDGFTIQVHSLLQAELAGGYWTPRALCILEGSIKRSVAANFWVRRIVDTIRDNPERNYVISDMRFKSEADTLKILLGNHMTVMRISRDKTVDTQDPSERDMDDYKFDIVMDNTGTQDSFFSTLDWILLHNRNY